MKVKYVETVMYPFTFEILKDDGVVVATCAQIPGIIMQCDSMVELKAEAIRLLDSWFWVTKKIEKDRRRKEKVKK